MTYQQTLEFLFSQLPVYQRDGKAAYKANLDNTHAIDKYFNHPHTKFKSVHVAGTNGKGSVSHMIASVLQQAGFKTGLYTSPHLKDFRERIKINGQCISEEEVVEFVSVNQTMIEDMKPSFFELTVGMAFEYFAKQKVDIAIIETGMGGRLDSTNIIKPLVSVITNIGMDHTQYLGNTLADIAQEKAGIIKSNVPVVIGQQQAETMPVFEKIARDNSAPICFADKRLSINSAKADSEFQHFVVKNYQSGTSFEYDLDLLGKYQRKNLLTALTTLELLVPILGLDKHHIVDGLQRVVSNTGLLGRWQILGKKPLTICDTAHNKEGLIEVIEQLTKLRFNQLHLVLGFVNDKSIKELLSLFPKNAKYYYSSPKIPRALEVEALLSVSKDLELHGNAYQSVEEAFKEAKWNAGDDDLIYVGGSTFVVAEII